MKGWQLYALSGVLRVIPRLRLSELGQIESASQLWQGKGWGAGTVRQEVAAALSLLKPARRTALLALDVGANVGNWTAALLEVAPQAHVVAFEPSTAAFRLLADRFQDDERVSLRKQAAGARHGLTTLWADCAGSRLASLSRRRLEHVGLDFRHSEEVEMITLNSWGEETGRAPDLLKMDVEGHELDVLNGASSIMESVSVVQFEFGGCNIDSRTFFQDFWYYFKEMGFNLYRLGPNGLGLLSQYTESDECFRTTNYFAARPEPLK